MSSYFDLSTARKQSEPEVATGLSAHEVISRLKLPEDSQYAQQLKGISADSLSITTRHFYQYDFRAGKSSQDVVNHLVAAESPDSLQSTRLFDISTSSPLTSEQVDLARAALPKPDYSGIPWLQERISAVLAKS